MKYEFVSMVPLDEFDSIIMVRAAPTWLEKAMGKTSRVLKYYGSGTTWREGNGGSRCSSFTSEWLHQIWNRELNRKQEREDSPGPKEPC